MSGHQKDLQVFYSFREYLTFGISEHTSFFLPPLEYCHVLICGCGAQKKNFHKWKSRKGEFNGDQKQPLIIPVLWQENKKLGKVCSSNRKQIRLKTFLTNFASADRISCPYEIWDFSLLYFLLKLVQNPGCILPACGDEFFQLSPKDEDKQNKFHLKLTPCQKHNCHFYIFLFS